MTMIWRAIEPLLWALAILVIVGAAAYINIMFNRKITSESVIEALNYSV